MGLNKDLSADCEKRRGIEEGTGIAMANIGGHVAIAYICSLEV